MKFFPPPIPGGVIPDRGSNSNRFDMKKKMKDALGVICVGCILAACMVTNEAGDPCYVNAILLGIAVVTGLLSRMKVAK